MLDILRVLNFRLEWAVSSFDDECVTRCFTVWRKSWNCYFGVYFWL